MTPEEEAKQQKRVEQLDRIASAMLDDLEKLASSDKMTSADRKLILDFLRANGLNLDPNTVPQNLKGMLTSHVSFDDSDEKPKLKIG